MNTMNQENQKLFQYYEESQAEFPDFKDSELDRWLQTVWRWVLQKLGVIDTPSGQDETNLYAEKSLLDDILDTD